jgi:hypothetical protein
MPMTHPKDCFDVATWLEEEKSRQARNCDGHGWYPKEAWWETQVHRETPQVRLEIQAHRGGS